MARPEKHVLVCTHERPPGHELGSCEARGGMQVLDAFKQQFESRGLWGRLKLTRTGCLGTCPLGPTVLVYPEGVMYGKVSPADVSEIIDEHLLADRPVERLLAPADVW